MKKLLLLGLVGTALAVDAVDEPRYIQGKFTTLTITTTPAPDTTKVCVPKAPLQLQQAADKSWNIVVGTDGKCTFLPQGTTTLTFPTGVTDVTKLTWTALPDTIPIKLDSDKVTITFAKTKATAPATPITRTVDAADASKETVEWAADFTFESTDTAVIAEKYSLNAKISRSDKIVCLPSEYLAADNTCKTCPENCLTCESDAKCLTCADNFGVSDANPKCHTCDAKEWIKDSKCTTCPTNCASCTDDKKCKTCDADFYLPKGGVGVCGKCTGAEYPDTNKKECAACPQDCATCSSGTECLTCNGHTGLDDTKLCKPCQPAQITFENKCKSCEAHHISKNNKCDPCQARDIVENNACVPCAADKISKNNKCDACPTGQFVKGNECTTCKSNEFVESGNCKACPEGCTTCTDANTCTACDDKHKQDGKKCVKKSNWIIYVAIVVVILIIVAIVGFFLWRKKKADSLRAHLVYQNVEG